VTDPEHPEPLRWLDGPPNTMTIQVQVVDGTMITALEHPPPGLTIGDPNATPQDGFLIWDVREPDRPQLLGHWVSGGTDRHAPELLQQRPVGVRHQQPARLRGPGPGHRRPGQPQDGRHVVASRAAQGGR
jgi:hypothetical protein